MDCAIIGASGYTGGELIRLLATHSSANVVCATSRKLAGIPVDHVHPQLKGFTDLAFEHRDAGTIEADVAFLAVPHTAAMDWVPTLIERDITTIDLSADYRLDKNVYEKTYGVQHKHYIKAPYGLPELHRDEIRGTKFVANPGCFPTGATLAAAPLACRASAIIFDSKTGVSGAGNSPTETTHYCNVGDSVTPYKWTKHRHLAEMQQEIKRLGAKAPVYFTPHLVPMNRGILTTAHILLDEPIGQQEAEELYREFYTDEPFVRLQKPSPAAVRGTNFCDIALEVGENRVVVVSAIDNLVKGASGQAIQNMNLMCGFEETDGLRLAGLLP
jgi:N-acetyl-gamma-glutamyl-phosphate reductase